MILGFYLLSCFITMGLMSLQTYLTRIGYINIDPFEAMNKINEILEKEKDPKVKQLMENLFYSMMQSTFTFQLAVCFCPIFNLIFAVKIIIFILNNANKM